MLARLRITISALACAVTAFAQDKPGYTDTPRLPDSKWRVHDAERPRPPVVEPAPAAAVPARAPSDAVVLFGDGTQDDALGAWQRSTGKPAGWDVRDGAMIVNGSGDIETRQHFGDCQLHVEWMVSPTQEGEGQGRGNSGVFFFGRYEVQILDSYRNQTYADGQAAALYGQFPPLVNACRPPGEWQTFDFVFNAPRFDAEGRVVEPARVTLIHNGILVHDHRALLGATRHRAVAGYEAHADKGPIRLQDHGNPLHFRNIWIRDLPRSDEPGDEMRAATSKPTQRRE